RIRVVATAADDGRTCVALRNDKGDELAHRCTFGLVWPASAVANREGTALALAVQPVDGWRELWLFRKQKAGWTLRILPPAASAPPSSPAGRRGACASRERRWSAGKSARACSSSNGELTGGPFAFSAE